MTIDALKTLHTAMLDTCESYEVAERYATTPALKTFFEQMIALRAKDHEEIHLALTRQGKKPKEGMSFMATIHKTMTSARSTITGLDANALSPFIIGEDSIVDEYDKAIAEAAGNAPVSTMLTGQKITLETKIAEMKAFKAAALRV